MHGQCAVRVLLGMQLCGGDAATFEVVILVDGTLLRRQLGLASGSWRESWLEA